MDEEMIRGRGDVPDPPGEAERTDAVGPSPEGDAGAGPMEPEGTPEPADPAPSAPAVPDGEPAEAPSATEAVEGAPAPVASEGWDEEGDGIEEGYGGEEAEEEEEPLGAVGEVEVVGPCARRLRIEVPAEKVRERFDENYKELRKNAVIPGFRKGKVPRRYLERRFGAKIEEEIRKHLLDQSFREVVADRGLEALGEPVIEDVEMEPGEPFRYVAEVEVVPSIELPAYEGIEVEHGEVRVTDEEVEARLVALRDQAASIVPVAEDDDTVRADDQLVCRYRLLDGDKERFRCKRVLVVPERGVVDGIRIEGLAEGLRSRFGEHRFTVTPPPNFRDGHLAGRELVLVLEILDAKRMHLPDLEGELPGHFGCETLENLRDQVRESLAEQKRIQAERTFEERIVERIAEAADIPLPERFVRAEASRQEERAGRTGEPDLDTLQQVRGRLRKQFLLRAIARREGIEVSDAEVQAAISQWSERVLGQPGAALRDMEKTREFERVREAMLLEKTRERLRRLNETLGAGIGPSTGPEGAAGEPEALSESAAVADSEGGTDGGAAAAEEIGVEAPSETDRGAGPPGTPPEGGGDA